MKIDWLANQNTRTIQIIFIIINKDKDFSDLSHVLLLVWLLNLCLPWDYSKQ